MRMHVFTQVNMRFAGLILLSSFLSHPLVLGADQVLFAGTDAAPSTVADRYIGLFHSDNLANFGTTDTERTYFLASTSGTFKSFYAAVSTAPGGSASWVLTVRKNGLSTSITCTITGSATTCNDLLNTVSVTAGDYFNLLMSPSGSPSSTRIRWTLIFSSTTPDEAMFSSNTDGVAASAGVSYFPIQGAYGPGGATDSEVSQFTRIAGTIKNLYVLTGGGPITGSYVFTVRLNGVNTSLTCTMTGSNTACNDTTNTVAVAVNDLLDIREDESGTVGGQVTAWGVTFVPDVPGTFPHFFFPRNGAISAGTTNYHTFGGGTSTPNTDETIRESLGQSATLTEMRVLLSAAPGVQGSGWTFTTRQNEVATGLTCTILGSDTTCLISSNISVVVGDRLSVEIAPIGTPGISILAKIGWGLGQDSGDWGWTHRP